MAVVPPQDLPAGGWAPAPWTSAALCFLLSLAMHLPWLGLTPLAGTEAHRALPAHEMVVSGWWTVPILFGKPFMTKPPLHHWLIALSETVSGQANVFFWRLPSALDGALLCAAMAWFGGRWFGRGAGLISGLCGAGLIAIWGQSQVADIDATNTLAAALAAISGAELFFAPAARGRSALSHAFWILAAALAMSAVWLTKGPAGLPIILGVWLWAAWEGGSVGQRSPLRSIAFWFPLLAGIGVFLLYGLAAKLSLTAHHLPLDPNGLKEGARRIFPRTLSALVESILVPPLLFIFAMPVSVALPMAFHPDIRGQWDAASGRLARGLAMSVLISWVIAVIVGMGNPRYGYPTLMPLCPLAGAVAVAAARRRPTAAALRLTLASTAIGLAGATVGLSIAAWRMMPAGLSLGIIGAWEPAVFRPMLLAVMLIAVAAAAITLAGLRRSWRAAWLLVALLLTTSAPFGLQRHIARSKDSARFNSAAKLRSIVGQGTPVAMFAAAVDKPETFYYANVPVKLYPSRTEFLPDQVRPPIWVLLSGDERRRWLSDPSVRLERETWFCRNVPTDYYLAWYAGR